LPPDPARAGAPIDVVLDLLPPAASPTWVRAAVLAVRPCGRAILMGGIREDISLPYAWMIRHGIEVRGPGEGERGGGLCGRQ